MDELAFAPFLVGLEWWRGAVDAGWMAFEALTPCPSPERAAVSRCGGASAAFEMTAKQEPGVLGEQTDQVLAATRGASEEIRHEIIGEVAEAPTATLPGSEAPPRRSRAKTEPAA